MDGLCDPNVFTNSWAGFGAAHDDFTHNNTMTGTLFQPRVKLNLGRSIPKELMLNMKTQKLAYHMLFSTQR